MFAHILISYHFGENMNMNGFEHLKSIDSEVFISCSRSRFLNHLFFLLVVGY